MAETTTDGSILATSADGLGIRKGDVAWHHYMGVLKRVTVGGYARMFTDNSRLDCKPGAYVQPKELYCTYGAAHEAAVAFRMSELREAERTLARARKALEKLLGQTKGATA
jgi:hypothetical protein